MLIKILFEFDRFIWASKRRKKWNSFEYMLEGGLYSVRGAYNQLKAPTVGKN